MSAMLLGVLGCIPVQTSPPNSLTQEQAPSPQQLTNPPPAAPVPSTFPLAAAGDKPFPINLPSALQLANARSLDITVASQRIQVAAAQLERANVLWLPTLQFGTDYYRHDGRIQDVQGNLFDTNKSTFLIGGAPIAIFAVSDAIFAPLAARQVVRAQQAGLQAATNDTTLAVAESYFNVQQARGQLMGAMDAVSHAEDLLKRTERLKAEVEVRRSKWCGCVPSCRNAG